MSKDDKQKDQILPKINNHNTKLESGLIHFIQSENINDGIAREMDEYVEDEEEDEDEEDFDQNE